MQPRPIYQTTEFWIAPIMAGLVFCAQQLGLDISTADWVNFIPTALWVFARIIQKLAGPTDTNGVRAWQTVPFWVGLAFPFVRAFVPTLPPDIEATVNGLLTPLIGLLIGKATVMPVFAGVDVTKKESNVTPTE